LPHGKRFLRVGRNDEKDEGRGGEHEGCFGGRSFGATVGRLRTRWLGIKRRPGVPRCQSQSGSLTFPVGTTPARAVTCRASPLTISCSSPARPVSMSGRDWRRRASRPSAPGLAQRPPGARGGGVEPGGGHRDHGPPHRHRRPKGVRSDQTRRVRRDAGDVHRRGRLATRDAETLDRGDGEGGSIRERAGSASMGGSSSRTSICKKTPGVAKSRVPAGKHNCPHDTASLGLGARSRR